MFVCLQNVYLTSELLQSSHDPPPSSSAAQRALRHLSGNAPKATPTAHTFFMRAHTLAPASKYQVLVVATPLIRRASMSFSWQPLQVWLPRQCRFSAQKL
jgi:hypothetical protein